MRAANDISRRMREMLTNDKLGVKEGFSAALKGDMQKLMSDYFVMASPIDLRIERRTDGDYAVSATFVASDVKQFDTTLDIKRF